MWIPHVTVVTRPMQLLHTFWSCPSLQNYWSQIFKTLSEVLTNHIEHLAFIALFGTISPSLNIPKYKSDFVAFLTLLARCLILLNWISPKHPTHSLWIKDVFHFVKLEKYQTHNEWIL